MEKKDRAFSNIPEVIDPGITIPIFEEDVDSISMEQPQKLGSYRARAGKFSNTLSNLLPSISAKLHHSKKQGKQSDTNTDSGSESLVGGNLSSKASTEIFNTDRSPSSISQARVSFSNNNNNTTNGTYIDGNGQHPGNTVFNDDITPPRDMEKLVHFPETTEYLMSRPRTSNDSFGNNLPRQVSRTRNNTMSSQITSISSIVPKPLPNMVWSNNNNNNNNDMMQQTSQIIPQINTYNPNPSEMQHQQQQQQYQNFIDGMQGNNNLSVNNNAWNSNRPRSHSNASSIYTDAQQYDGMGRSRATSDYVGAGHIQNNMPLVADEVDPRSLNWVSTDPLVPQINQISNLLPTNTISISNVFPLQQQQPHLNNAINLTSTSLATLCSKYGEIISARTLRGINMALVEFDTVESAIRALDALEGKEVSMIGAPSKVSFAKILPMQHQLATHLQQQNLQPQQEHISQPLLQEQLYNGAVTFHQQGNISIPVFNQNQFNNNQNNSTQNFSHSGNSSSEKEQCPFPLPPPALKEQREELQKIVDQFISDHDDTQVTSLINNAIKTKVTVDINNFGPLPEPIANKQFDAPKLRELRKAIDSNSMSDIEIEQLAIAMLDELPELSSDYLGNTIVQKLFEHSSDVIKDIMLRKTGKYLASMGVHKNGTWACQKMITMATTPRQIMLVTEGIRDYCTPLFNDQFGNYVIQCVLKFGYPWNSFIFESILTNFWTIVQNRYGARAVRACLETHDIVTMEQTLVLSAIIVLYAEYLTTNSNGTLLVTWFLDTCVLPNRHSILTPRLITHIVDLCKHRLASLTILKILNYRGDDAARKSILSTVFGNCDTEEPQKNLFQILCDANYGPTFVYKVLSMPLLEDDIRIHIITQVRKVLMENPSAQHHRRLMEEVGLVATSSQMNSNSQTGQNAANGQMKHRKSISHVYNNQDSAGHMRGVSVSSVRSAGSRQTGLTPAKPTTFQMPNLPTGSMSTVVSGNIPIGNQMSSQQGIPAQQQTSQGSMLPQANQTQSGIGYSNYPGMFPMGYQGSSNGYAMNDDIVSKLDMLTLSNGTHLSLPQLSVTNHENSSTTFNDPNVNMLNQTMSNNPSDLGNHSSNLWN
ncbi:Jsn1p [Nakaseomyces bracarensis]|uniref:Jsn1p n=1 Tax=Nakaseomyces bracarensis TaxID=273131 RepID=UPI0038717FF7